MVSSLLAFGVEERLSKGEGLFWVVGVGVVVLM